MVSGGETCRRPRREASGAAIDLASGETRDGPKGFDQVWCNQIGSTCVYMSKRGDSCVDSRSAHHVYATERRAGSAGTIHKYGT